MQLVMLRYDEQAPDVDTVFLEFAKASCKAQELELLLKANLQYSLALAGSFGDIDASDKSARVHDVVSMGQIYEGLEPYLIDKSLGLMIERAIGTRNTLAHHFFCRHQAGIVLTETESADAIKWCRAATAEFTGVCRKLEARWWELAVLLADNPSAVPGIQARLDAIDRGEWP